MTQVVPGTEYEAAIMDAHAKGKPAPDMKPAEPYQMSEEFQRWLVEAMREAILDSDELGAAIMGAGKDNQPGL